jgi:hypothetical protein
MPVDQLSGRRLVVPRQQHDRLHRHAMSRQQRHERMPQLPRHPRPPQSRSLRDYPELPPHIVVIHRRPDGRSEHEVVVLPQRPSRQPVLRLPHPVLPQRLNALTRQRQRPTRPRRLRVPAGPVRAPHEHRQLLVLESNRAHGLPLPVNPGHDVIPAQRPDLFRPQSREQGQDDVRLQPRPLSRGHQHDRLL